MAPEANGARRETCVTSPCARRVLVGWGRLPLRLSAVEDSLSREGDRHATMKNARAFVLRFLYQQRSVRDALC